MKIKEKKNEFITQPVAAIFPYESPALEVIHVMVENGMMTSTGDGTISGWEPDNGYWEI